MGIFCIATSVFVMVSLISHYYDDMIAEHFAKSLSLNYAAMKPETKAIVRKSAVLCSFYL